jgi:hypothetical protein
MRLRWSSNESLRLNAYRLMSERGYLKRVANAGSKLARWHHYVEQLGRPGPLLSNDPMVQPRIFPVMEGLHTPPWRDSNQHPASAILEKAVASIRREIEAVNSSQHLNYTGSILAGGQWTVMPIFVFGEQMSPLLFSKNLFPETTRVLRNLPDACTALPLADIIFSAHAPQARLVPHCSWDPFRLRLHLGLRVPKNCGIRVGNESREWQEGKVLAFHDACEHETWNDSDETRIVLIVDVWHPDLTLIEREAILACFRKKEIRTALMRIRIPPAIQPILSRTFAQMDSSDPLVAEYWDN